MDTIAIVDFGGQYAHLIANRIRRLGVYSEIIQNDVDAYACREFKGIILSGSPFSVLAPNHPLLNPAILDLPIPVLGLCYGHQLMSAMLGGRVHKGNEREYGSADLKIFGCSGLFDGMDQTERIWMSHGDSVAQVPEGFSIIASTDQCAVAAMSNESRKRYGLQFHPEVTHSPNGMKLLDNFISICACERTWNSKNYVTHIQEMVREKCAGKKVFLLVSGGVDSTVAFALLNKTLGPDRVKGLHIDNGLMRQGESADIISYMRREGFDNLTVVDASETFLSRLNGVADPESKRKIIGDTFIEVSLQEQARMGLNPDDWLLGQGTIYPDTIESAGTKHADKIKTHHNRVDVVMELIRQGRVIEPLAQLYKDEVRDMGESLGLPHDLVWRHPFPGPGLGVRALCSDGVSNPVDPALQQQLDELCAVAGYKGMVLPIRSVGVQGDERSYAHPALIVGDRNWQALEDLSTRITNSIRGINRVVYAVGMKTLPVGYALHQSYCTRERLNELRAIDAMVTATLKEQNEYETVWQMPVVILPLVNISGRECIVLRPISSQEAMTARFLPLHDNTIRQIVDNTEQILPGTDLFYDITHKPPGTIEWE